MLSQLPDDLLVGRRCPEYPGGGPCCGPFGYAGGGGGGAAEAKETPGLVAPEIPSVAGAGVPTMVAAG